MTPRVATSAHAAGFPVTGQCATIHSKQRIHSSQAGAGTGLVGSTASVSGSTGGERLVSQSTPWHPVAPTARRPCLQSQAESYTAAGEFVGIAGNTAVAGTVAAGAESTGGRALISGAQSSRPGIQCDQRRAHRHVSVASSSQGIADTGTKAAQAIAGTRARAESTGGELLAGVTWRGSQSSRPWQPVSPQPHTRPGLQSQAARPSYKAETPNFAGTAEPGTSGIFASGTAGAGIAREGAAGTSAGALFTLGTAGTSRTLLAPGTAAKIGAARRNITNFLRITNRDGISWLLRRNGGKDRDYHRF